MQICESCAHDFDPLGDNKVEDPDRVGYAIDGQPDTKWTTETYYGGTLGKAGVGLYLDAAPGVSARFMRVRDRHPWLLRPNLRAQREPAAHLAPTPAGT